jgi:hypothetical protein
MVYKLFDLSSNFYVSFSSSMGRRHRIGKRSFESRYKKYVRGAIKFNKRINAINANRQARYEARIKKEKANLEPECEEIPEIEEVDDYSDCRSEFDRNDGKYPVVLRSAMITFCLAVLCIQGNKSYLAFVLYPHSKRFNNFSIWVMRFTNSWKLPFSFF